MATVLDDLRSRLAPTTLIAEVQMVWPLAAGDAFAAVARPVTERDGVVTIACTSAVWAQELDLLSDRVLQALNDRLGRPAVKRLRVTARPPRP